MVFFDKANHPNAIRTLKITETQNFSSSELCRPVRTFPRQFTNKLRATSYWLHYTPHHILCQLYGHICPSTIMITCLDEVLMLFIFRCILGTTIRNPKSNRVLTKLTGSSQDRTNISIFQTLGKLNVGTWTSRNNNCLPFPQGSRSHKHFYYSSIIFHTLLVKRIEFCSVLP